MNRLALSVMLVLAASNVAMAGGYLGIGIGDDPAISSNVGYMPDGRSGRFLLGYRFSGFKFGAASIEGAYSGYGLSRDTAEARELSASAKYNFPLGSDFEVFGRLGLQHTKVTANNPIYDAAGNGYLVGAGLEYRFDLGAVGGSFWLDYTHHAADIQGERQKTEYTARMWTLGLSLGL